MHTRRRSAGFLAAVTILAFACGPSEQAQFDAAFEDGEAALLADDLTGAQLHFEDALRLQPGDAAALAALALVADISASRDRYEEAVSLLDQGRNLLEARSLFLEIPEGDFVRYGEAQRSARVAEERWIEESMELLDRRLAGDDFSAVTLSISEFRRQLPRSELLESAIAESSDALIASAVRIATVNIEAGDLSAAQRVLTGASNALRLDEPPAAFIAVRQAIDQQREIIAQARQAELAEQRAQRERELAPKMVRIGESAIGSDGLTVTVTSVSTSERPGSFVYTVSYRLENRTDRAIDEGSFKLYGPTSSLPQYGFFTRMFPTDVVERTAVFEEVKSQRFDLLAYHGDQFFAARPPQGSLAWSIPEP